MSLEQQLRDVLAEQAERCPVPPGDLNATVAGGTSRRRRSRRRTTLAAGAAVLLATLGGVAAWNTQTENRSTGVTDQPADSDQAAETDCLTPGEVPGYSVTTRDRPDFIGGPAVNPQRDDRGCWVVLRMYLHNGPPGNAALTGKVWLYSDGRVIGWTDSTDGLIEQRLTPEGVELVRTMAVDHLSEERVAPWASARQCRQASAPGRECSGTVPYQGRTHWISDYAELADRLFDLSWLPDRAWVREEPQPYTPNWWRACYGGREPGDGETWSGDHPVDRQRVLDRLPDEAAALLRDKDTTTVPLPWRQDNGVQGETRKFCTIVGATEQQAIINSLDLPGSEERIPLGLIDEIPAELVFLPLVPDGEPPCFCG